MGNSKLTVNPLRSKQSDHNELFLGAEFQPRN